MPFADSPIVGLKEDVPIPCPLWKRNRTGGTFPKMIEWVRTSLIERDRPNVQLDSGVLASPSSLVRETLVAERLER